MMSVKKLASFIVKLEKTYLKNYRKIERIIQNIAKIETNVIHVNPFISAITLKDAGFPIIARKEKNSKKLQSIVSKINKNYYIFFNKLEGFKSMIKYNFPPEMHDFVLFYIGKIEKISYKYLGTFEIMESTSYTDLIAKKSEFLDITEKIKKYLGIIEHSIDKEKSYTLKLNPEKYKQISVKDLEVGDIIIVQREGLTGSYFTKIIQKVLKSPVTHTALVYKRENSKIYVFEANAYNFRRTEINLLEFKKEYNFFVARLKEKLKDEEKQKVKAAIEHNLNIHYSFLKLIGYLIRSKSRNLLKRMKNPFRYVKGVFCSEIICSIYSSIGRKLFPYDDCTSITPVDIINSKQLKILGYLRK